MKIMLKVEIAHGFTTDMVYAIAGTFTGGLSSKGFKLFLSDWYNVKKVIPIVDDKAEIDGQKAYKGLSNVPEKIDVVIVVHKPNITTKIVEEAVRLQNKPAIWFMPGTESPESITLCEEYGLTYAKSCMWGHTEFTGFGRFVSPHYYHSKFAGFNRIPKQPSFKELDYELEVETK